MSTVTAQALQKLRQRSREGTPEEGNLEATSENRHTGCGRDMFGQTVPSMGSSNREGLITDSRQPCTTDIQRQWGSDCLWVGLHRVIGVASYGALGQVPPPSLDLQLFNFSAHFRAAKNLTLKRIYWPIYSFLSVYCVNFRIFLCVTIKLFSLSVMLLLARNPGDANAMRSALYPRICSHSRRWFLLRDHSEAKTYRTLFNFFTYLQLSYIVAVITALLAGSIFTHRILFSLYAQRLDIELTA